MAAAALPPSLLNPATRDIAVTGTEVSHEATASEVLLIAVEDAPEARALLGVGGTASEGTEAGDGEADVALRPSIDGCSMQLNHDHSRIPLGEV